MKRLDETGEFRVTHSTADSITGDIEILLKFWEKKWAHEKGDRLKGILSNNRVMIRRAFEFGNATVLVLWTGDRPLAAHAILTDNLKRTASFMIGARDETYNSPPPGFMLHCDTIRWAIKNGFTVFDFLQGNEDYKYMFGAQDRFVKCVFVTTKTKLNLEEKLDPAFLEPALKRATETHKAGKLEQAARGYRQIIDTDPRHAGALFLFAQLEAVRANHAAAEELFKSYLAVKPKAADGLVASRQGAAGAGPRPGGDGELPQVPRDRARQPRGSCARGAGFAPG